MKNIVEIKDGAFSYTDCSVFKNVNININKNELVGVYGENGSGKSTLFKIIAKEVKLQSGEIFTFDSLTTSFLGQNDRVMAEGSPLTLMEFLLMYQHKEKSKLFKNKKNVMMLLRKYNMEHYAKKQLKSLSGGQLQKSMILKSIMNQPDIILFDEPLNALDEINKISVMDMIMDLHNNGHTILLILHDYKQLKKIADKILICENHIIKCEVLNYA